MEKYYTEKELITVKELEKRWHIDTEELARIVVENSLTIFCSKYARERKCCIFFVGFEIQYEKSIDGIFECLENFTDGYKIIKNKEGNSEDVDIFLLFSDIQKYETNKPFLVGDPVEADYRAAVDKTIRDKERLPPMPPALNGGHSEEQSQGERIVELEEQLAKAQDEIERLKLQLAENTTAQGQGVDAEQAEVLRKELKATKAKLQDALEGHGLCSLVIRERQAGKTDQEIDSELKRLNVTRNIHRAVLLHRGSEAATEDARKRARTRSLK